MTAVAQKGRGFQLNMPSTCGGRGPPVQPKSAVGANPPQETLRPMYRRGKATLESSRACPGSPTVQAALAAETLRSTTERGGTKSFAAPKCRFIDGVPHGDSSPHVQRRTRPQPRR